MTMTDDIMTDDIMTVLITLMSRLPCTRHVTLRAAQMSGKILNSNNIPTARTQTNVGRHDERISNK
ncbi:unnamed protein product [Callosobruchus maculatus]|uniref:Uncharacterized protein n=1 Tax=Callosobruchus maculatus TaxID=64391 RepID=A0A653CB54_CALMS|nr:unnamed protein product [Callosobruchus maculatus]